MEKDERLKQVGGDHYEQMAVEPFEIAETMQLTPMQFTVLKYVSRWRRKNGVEDLRKAMQTCRKAHLYYCNMPTTYREERPTDKLMIRMYCAVNGLGEDERVVLTNVVSNRFTSAASRLEGMIVGEEAMKSERLEQ